jgi:hypothetical protein
MKICLWQTLAIPPLIESNPWCGATSSTTWRSPPHQFVNMWVFVITLMLTSKDRFRRTHLWLLTLIVRQVSLVLIKTLIQEIRNRPLNCLINTEYNNINK